MAFFFIVLGVMAVSIHFIYFLMKWLGWHMEYKSLMMCPVMALAVTLGMILLSPYLTQTCYIKLGILILAASGVVTAYDAYLGRRTVLSAEGPDAPGVRQTESVSKAGKEGDPRLQKEPVPAADGVSLSETAETDSAAGAATGKPESGEAVLEQAPSQEIASGETDSKVKDVQEELPPDPAEICSQMESLDDILDYAYEQRAQGNLQAAALAQRKALERYGGDDYAPFMVIELGDIYKEQADYGAAVRVYEQSLKLPAIAENDEVYQKFSTNLLYLRTVQSVLSKHDALKVSFQDIPREYLEEIETVFLQRSREHSE